MFMVCVIVVLFVDLGKCVLLVSIDLVFNLQDVFGMEFFNYFVFVIGMNNLDVVNFDFEIVVNEYKVEMVGLYCGVFLDIVIVMMEE